LIDVDRQLVKFYENFFFLSLIMIVW